MNVERVATEPRANKRHNPGPVAALFWLFHRTHRAARFPEPRT